MLKWLVAILWALLPATVSATSFNLTPAEFDSCQVPSVEWGQVYVYFTVNGTGFTAIHDFGDPDHPIIMVTTAGTDSVQFSSVVADIRLWWIIGGVIFKCPREPSTPFNCALILWDAPQTDYGRLMDFTRGGLIHAVRELYGGFSGWRVNQITIYCNEDSTTYR